jgi:hypothetical protein
VTTGDVVKNLFDAAYSGDLLPGYRFDSDVTVTKGEDEVSGKGLVSRYSTDEESGNIIRGDLRIKLQHSVFGEVDDTCSITYQGRSPRVLSVKPIELNGVVYEYEVHARG